MATIDDQVAVKQQHSNGNTLLQQGSISRAETM